MSVLFNYYFITFVNTILTSTDIKGVCSNVSDGSPLRCCSNYRLVGNYCKECWPGTGGIDCMKNCPANFYGRLCAEICDCKTCDRVHGCQNGTDKDQNSSSNMPSSKEDESPATSVTWPILSVVAFCFVFCFIFCLRIFFILRRMRAKNPNNLAEYDSKIQMVPLENSRYSMSLTSRTIDSSQTNDTETSYDKCQTSDPNNMTETTSQNAYGHVDSSDGVYNILKLIVSDKNDHMQIINNNSTPLEKLNNTNMDDDTSQMASTVSNIVKTENNESKIAIHREKRKHQKELFRALDEFKKGGTRDRKKLRYSFTKSTELF